MCRIWPRSFRPRRLGSSSKPVQLPHPLVAPAAHREVVKDPAGPPLRVLVSNELRPALPGTQKRLLDEIARFFDVSGEEVCLAHQRGFRDAEEEHVVMLLVVLRLTPRVIRWVGVDHDVLPAFSPFILISTHQI